MNTVKLRQKLAALLQDEAATEETAASALDLAKKLLARSDSAPFDRFLYGRSLFAAGDYTAARQTLAALTDDKQLAPTQRALVWDTLRLLAETTGDMEYGATCAKNAMLLADGPDALTACSNYILSLFYTDERGDKIKAAAEIYGRTIDRLIPAQLPAPYEYPAAERQRRAERTGNATLDFPAEPLPVGKIRIGYISPDFCRHVMIRFVHCFLAAYDDSRFEITCYFTGQPDDYTARIKKAAVTWVDLAGETATAIAQRIHDDGIDILVDLAGHSRGNSLPVLALKPAPVIISGVGFMGTTGLKAVDYFLTDRYLAAAYGVIDIPQETPLPKPADLPPEARAALDAWSPAKLPGDNAIRFAHSSNFTEELLILPHSHWCYTPEPAKLPLLPPPCKKNGYITFGSLNNFRKLSDEILSLWSLLLEMVPNSRLFLKAAIFDRPAAKQAALARLERAGIDPARLVTEGYSDDYLAAYDAIDIALDCYPYGGGGTTADALSKGVPVVAFRGLRHGSRFSYSLLMNAGLGDLAVDTPAEYLAAACRLATNPARLEEIRAAVPRRLVQTPAMDDLCYMAQLETAYETVWRRFTTGDDGDAPPLKLTAGLAQLAFDQNWKAALLPSYRLSAYPQLSVDERAFIGISLYNNGHGQKAVHFLRPLLVEPSATIKYLYFLGESYAKLSYHAAIFHTYHATRSKLPLRLNPSEDDKIWYSEIALRLSDTCLTLGLLEESRRFRWESMSCAPRADLHNAIFASYLMSLNFGHVTPVERFRLHKEYGASLLPVKQYDPRRPKRERLRIGYISPDLRRHVMFWYVYQMFCGHDRDRFEVYAYMTGATSDLYTDLVRDHVDHYQNIHGKKLAEMAQLVAADELDILIDLAGHSADSGVEVFRYRVAPVQISGLGYMATTAIPDADYFLTDQWSDPPETDPQQWFTEKLLYLPSQFCFTGRSDLPECTGAPCKKNGYVTFASFNNCRKLDDEHIVLWHDIMAQVPNSRLLIKSPYIYDKATQNILWQRLKRLAFNMDRVDIEPFSKDYMYRYLDVDIHLDTYPYPGGGTTCDALYMGVPVVARRGYDHSSRFADSFLSAANCEEFLTTGPEHYVALASALASDTDLLDKYHRLLRKRLLASPLMDTRGYVSALERACTEYVELARKKYGTL